jgi:hypothetical protein
MAGVGLLREGCLTRAGLLLAGREQSIRAHVPTYVAESMKMSGDTDYKEPPVIQRRGATILLTFLAGDFSPVFRAWVATQERLGRNIMVSGNVRIGSSIGYASSPKKVSTPI